MSSNNVPETFSIPVGPLHVALEEPMYFKIDVQGETVTHVDINAGHVHRGIEYLTTKRTMYQNVVLTATPGATAPDKPISHRASIHP